MKVTTLDEKSIRDIGHAFNMKLQRRANSNVRCLFREETTSNYMSVNLIA